MPMSVEIPRSRCRLETIEVCEALVLWYGEAGLMANELMPWFMRLSTLLRRDSAVDSGCWWLMDGKGGLFGWCCCSWS